MKTSGNKRIAERYVRAIFEVAQDASAIDAVEKDLISLKHALEESADFRDFLSNPLLSREAQGKAMLAILDKMKTNQLTRQFIGMLIAQKRLSLLGDIASLFIEWAQSSRGELKAELVSATALKDREISTVADRLGKAYGRKVNVQARQDASLLGGMVVKIGSLQLDSSLSGKLARIAQKLKAA